MTTEPVPRPNPPHPTSGATTVPTTASPPTPGPTADDPTIGRLVVDATRDLSTLVSQEIQLAKSELKISLKAGGLGAGLFAAAAFLAVLAVIMLSVAIAYFIHWNGSGLDLQWAFLIVFVVYLLLAGLLAWLGLKKVRQVSAPEKAISQGKEIPRALKGKA